MSARRGAGLQPVPLAGTDRSAGTDGSAGTDKSKATRRGGPAIVLVDPQLGENIGMVARAMLNCGLEELRLVRPRDGWPNPAAQNAAAGADQVLAQARLFETTAEAVADLQRVYAVPVDNTGAA